MPHLKARAAAIAAVVGLSLTGAGIANGATSPEPGRQAAALAPGNSVNSSSIIDGSIYQADINADVVSLLRTPRASSVYTSALVDNVVTEAKLSPAVRTKLNTSGGPAGPAGPAGPPGPVGPQGTPGTTPTYLPYWGVMNAGIAGNGNAALAGSPNTTMPGLGALNLRTSDTGDRAAFGNQVSFNGDLVDELNDMYYAVETTQLNIVQGPNNMPGLSLQINPDVVAAGDATVSLQYVPANPPIGTAFGYSPQTDTDPNWGLTGSYFNMTGLEDVRCGTTGAQCTWSQILAVLGPNAAITTGLEFFKLGGPFSGSVDMFGINDAYFDFELGGVMVLNTGVARASKLAPPKLRN